MGVIRIKNVLANRVIVLAIRTQNVTVIHAIVAVRNSQFKTPPKKGGGVFNWLRG